MAYMVYEDVKNEAHVKDDERRMNNAMVLSGSINSKLPSKSPQVK
jgi:hypothetical protein